MKTLSISFVLVLFMLLNVSVVSADPLLAAFNRTGFDDVAIWPGPCGQSLSAVTATSSGGIGVTATNTEAQGSIAQMKQYEPWCDGGTWMGNFAQGNSLLWTQGLGTIELVLTQAVFGIGTQFQSNAISGSFTARLTVYDENTLLGSVTSAGQAGYLGDNSAIFLGIFGTNITRAVLSLDSCTLNCNDFAINQMSLQTISTVPEASSIWLLGIGVLGLVSCRRFRVDRTAAPFAYSLSTSSLCRHFPKDLLFLRAGGKLRNLANLDLIQLLSPRRYF
jgi:hypothetical protein